MHRILTLLLFLVPILAQNQCQTDRLKAVISGSQPARGTNLGSWFVLEAWMANLPWEQNNCDKNGDMGSYLLEKCLGGKAQEVMEQHWKTWIVEDDFVQMSKHGVNLARLPVGWWHVSCFCWRSFHHGECLQNKEFYRYMILMEESVMLICTGMFNQELMLQEV